MRPTWRNCLILIGVLVAQLACGLGCDDDRSIHTYQTAKETPPPASPFGTSGMSAMPIAKLTIAPNAIAWKLPTGWKRVPIPPDPTAQQLEFARFSVSADSPSTVLTADPIAGEGGGVMMNVQRWEGQLKLPITQSPDDINALLHPLNTPVGQALVVDFSSPPGSADPQRIVGAILAHEHDGMTWFLTLKGPKNVIDLQRKNFDAFVASITFPDDATGGTDPGAMAPSATQPAESAGTGGIASYRAPAEWKPAPADNGYRVLGFSSGALLITAERLDNISGDQRLVNVNMWRKEVGLPSVANESDIHPPPFVIDGRAGYFYDFQGPAERGGKRLLVATTRVGHADWFFKMTGPSDAVAGQVFQAFIPFVQSIHFTAGSAGDTGGGK